MICVTSLLLIFSGTVFVDCQNLTANLLIRSQENDVYRLLNEGLAGYEPKSAISDYAAIDLDQDAIEDELDRESDEGFKNARLIYEQGGHSKPYAKITLKVLPSSPVPRFTKITGRNSSGRTVNGKSYLTDQNNVLDIRYESKDGLEGAYPGCNVGALTPIKKERVYGCFESAGVLQATIDGKDESFDYTYDVLADNKNGRTIKGFSTLVEKDMLKCVGCPYPDAKYAVDYYNTPSYGNEWIEAAFEKRSTSLERGNADFANYGYVGRAEAIKVGIVAMNVLIYALREFEDAIRDCEAGERDAGLQNWDEGVALYVGSLEEGGIAGSLDGKFLHQMADRYCSIFKTCDKKGTKTSGTSKVNYDMLNLFDKGQKHLARYECRELKKVKEKIASLMYIPLIQGTLHAAYRVEYLDGYQRFQAQGAAFAAAVLPRVHAANKDAAKIIYENMRVGAVKTSHKAVKEAFQSVYTDLNIDCGLVGGMWHESLGIYYKGGAPCLQSESTMTALILLAASGSILFGLIGTFFHYRGKRQAESIEYFS